MTFVGKILVILIMAFSLVFLGVSTVVFTTATAWKEKSVNLQKEVEKLKGQGRDLEARVKDAQTKLDTAKTEHSKLTLEKENRITDLTKQVTDAEGQMNDARTQLQVAQSNAQIALAEATARKVQIEALIETLTKAQGQADAFSAQNILLTDNIRILEREKATAEQNAKDLRSFVSKVSALLREKGISVTNIDKYDETKVPPAVEGKIVEVNATSRSFELSIGEDDGLKVGQELYVFRLQPRAEYLGKVKIVSVYPDKAVADVIGQTVNRKKVQEGDIVSSSFNAR